MDLGSTSNGSSIEVWVKARMLIFLDPLRISVERRAIADRMQAGSPHHLEGRALKAEEKPVVCGVSSPAGWTSKRVERRRICFFFGSWRFFRQNQAPFFGLVNLCFLYNFIMLLLKFIKWMYLWVRLEFEMTAHPACGMPIHADWGRLGSGLRKCMKLKGTVEQKEIERHEQHD